MPTDEEVVQTAAEAAEGVILAHYRQSELTDFDVTVTFEDRVLDVDVYVNAPEEGNDASDADAGDDAPDAAETPDTPNAEEVADEAARAAGDAVDELFAAADESE